MAILTKKIKNFHKNKVDSFEKLSTRACLFYDFLHFKGCPYLNHKISWQDKLIQQNWFKSKVFQMIYRYFLVKRYLVQLHIADLYKFFKKNWRLFWMFHGKWFTVDWMRVRDKKSRLHRKYSDAKIDKK